MTFIWDWPKVVMSAQLLNHPTNRPFNCPIGGDTHGWKPLDCAGMV